MYRCILHVHTVLSVICQTIISNKIIVRSHPDDYVTLEELTIAPTYRSILFYTTCGVMVMASIVSFAISTLNRFRLAHVMAFGSSLPLVLAFKLCRMAWELVATISTGVQSTLVVLIIIAVLCTLQLLCIALYIHAVSISLRSFEHRECHVMSQRDCVLRHEREI